MVQEPAQGLVDPGVVARVIGGDGAPSALELVVLFEPAVERDGGVRNDRRDDGGDDELDRPSLVDADEHSGRAVGDEHETVQRSADENAEATRLRDVLQQHPADEQRPGHGLGDGDNAVEGAGAYAGDGLDGFGGH